MIRAASTLRKGDLLVQRLARTTTTTTQVPIAQPSTGTAAGFFYDDERRNNKNESSTSSPNFGVGGFASARNYYSSLSFHQQQQQPQRRFMSSDSSSSSPDNGDKTNNFDETMDNLFHETQREAQTDGDAWFLDAASDATSQLWEPTWWNFADQAIRVVNFMHETTGLEYAGSIFATTACIRLLILPIAVRAQRGASRMAHLQPELQLVKDRYEALGTPTQAEQRAFADQMKGLFQRYEVNPFQTMAMPFIQAPIFLGMFFGMKKMPDLFPDELAAGGLFWFADLTVPDPTYILPVACGITFLATIEAGKEQMIDGNPKYGPVIVNAFRAMCVVMVPVMTTFPAAMLCYWVPNNLITFIQSATLRNAWVKKQLGIWDRPKPIPGSTNNDSGFQETMQNLVKKVQGEPTTEKGKIQQHNEDIEAKKKIQKMSRETRARLSKKK